MHAPDYQNSPPRGVNRSEPSHFSLRRVLSGLWRGPESREAREARIREHKLRQFRADLDYFRASGAFPHTFPKGGRHDQRRSG